MRLWHFLPRRPVAHLDWEPGGRPCRAAAVNQRNAQDTHQEALPPCQPHRTLRSPHFRLSARVPRGLATAASEAAWSPGKTGGKQFPQRIHTQATKGHSFSAGDKVGRIPQTASLPRPPEQQSILPGRLPQQRQRWWVAAWDGEGSLELNHLTNNRKTHGVTHPSCTKYKG